MTTVSRILATAAATSAMSACTDVGAPVTAAPTAAAPIIGGGPAPDDHAVVLLAAYPNDRSVLATCTATVIADDVLLTAAHCIDHPGWRYGMFVGADAAIYPTLADLEPHLAPVTAVHLHPSYQRTPPFAADIGVALLAQPTTIAPLPIGRVALGPDVVGRPARIVGYGQATVGVASATRRQAATVVDGLDPDDTVRVGDAAHVTCLGDSGGPALVRVDGVETVIGVDSYADNGLCDRPAHFRRTDLYLSFIDTFAGAPAGPDAGQGTGADAGGDPGEDGGGCQVGGGRGVGLLVGLGAVALVRRRRGRGRGHSRTV